MGSHNRQPTLIAVATNNKHVASLVQRKLNYIGLSSVCFDLNCDALRNSIDESQSAIVVLDVNKNGAEALALAESLAKSHPRAKVVMLGGTADVTLMAKVVLTKVSHFLLDSTPAEEFASAIAGLIAGESPNAESMFGRVLYALPLPAEEAGAFRTPSGRALTKTEAIQQCDQFGLSVNEISRRLEVPISDVEVAKQEAQRIQKHSWIAEAMIAVTPEWNRRALSIRALGRAVAVVCALWLVMQIRFRGPSDRHEFSYPRVRGSVMYEDGSKIPLSGLSLKFFGEGGASGSGDLGLATVNGDSGSFECLLRVLPAQADRSVKVAIALKSGGRAPSNVVPSIYADFKTTPLIMSPQGGSVSLRIKKPSS